MMHTNHRYLKITDNGYNVDHMLLIHYVSQSGLLIIMIKLTAIILFIMSRLLYYSLLIFYLFSLMDGKLILY